MVTVAKLHVDSLVFAPVMVAKLGMYAIIGSSDARITAEISFDYKIDLILDLEFDFQILAPTEVTADITFDYGVSLYTDITFDYTIAFGAGITFDYRVLLSKALTFDYAISLYSDISFDYFTDGFVKNTIELDYKIALYTDITFDFAVPTIATITFDFAIGNAVNIELTYIERLPEIPIVERWVWQTSITVSRNNSERRVNARVNPRVQLSHTYAVQDAADMRLFQGHLWAWAQNEFIYVAQHSLAVFFPNMDAGNDFDIPCDLSATDIRADEYVVFFNVGDETSALRLVTAVGADYFTVEGGAPFGLNPSVCAMPVRRMRFGQAPATRLASIAGGCDVSFTDAVNRALVRPGAPANLVLVYDGYPVLMQRPIANGEITETVEAGRQYVDLTGDVLPFGVAPWAAVELYRPLSFIVPRGAGLDYWREFGDITKGSWRAFLAPTYRADLEPVSFVGSTLTVAGVKHLPLFDQATFKRIMITTESGDALYTITNSVEAAGNSQLTLNSAIAGATIRNVSFVELMRIADDYISLAHYEQDTVIEINVKTLRQ
jgi:hypothetical protein